MVSLWLNVGKLRCWESNQKQAVTHCFLLASDIVWSSPFLCVAGTVRLFHQKPGNVEDLSVVLLYSPLQGITIQEMWLVTAGFITKWHISQPKLLEFMRDVYVHSQHYLSRLDVFGNLMHLRISHKTYNSERAASTLSCFFGTDVCESKKTQKQ